MSNGEYKKIIVIAYEHFRSGFSGLFGDGRGFHFIPKQEGWDRMTNWRRAWSLRGCDTVHFFWAHLEPFDYFLIKLLNPRIDIILHFIGSDVLLIRKKSRLLRACRRYQRAGVRCYADHSGLIAELAAMGLRAKLLVLVNTVLTVHHQPLPKRFSVLAYVPRGHEDFYRLPLIEEAARRLPGVPFTILRNDRRFDLANLNSLPRTEDMIEEMNRHHVFLRLAEHDGLPCTLVEALSCARQVIWSFSHPHCHQAVSADDLVRILSDLQRKPRLNLAGQSYAIEHYNQTATRDHFLRVWNREN
jgi:hypothetical protein